MPPKGWRKNAEGSHPVHTKERDQISIDDILFPKATVTRLAKGVLSEGLISKDSVTAIQRSATAFVSYILVSARTNAKRFDRKTVSPQDIFAALKSCEFGDFSEHIQAELDRFLERKEQAKLLKKQNQQATDATATATTEGETNQENNDTVEEVEESQEHETAMQVDEEEAAEEPQAKKAKISKDDTVSETED
ncbi:hypothetical protein WICPIJ_004345 [Wickerhamomyces pijperi]|uniref:DNA polymerase epsilon subunit D n=1 Tax=Wickerhamomyces pijperi TaxID=599730 RepID=A0A9P8TN00_WICPI|nr:hypothetical protein WICPIJ_004345 [Wickerhamomyces pijperi]